MLSTRTLQWPLSTKICMASCQRYYSLCRYLRFASDLTPSIIRSLIFIGQARGDFGIGATKSCLDASQHSFRSVSHDRADIALSGYAHNRDDGSAEAFDAVLPKFSEYSGSLVCFAGLNF